MAGECVQKEGDIWISKPHNSSASSAFKPKTMEERLIIKEALGDSNLSKSLKFIQKGFNSNLEIPGYNNPELNGKGFSFNSHPNER